MSRVPLVLLALAAVLGAAGCGTDDPPAKPKPVAMATTREAASPAPTRTTTPSPTRTDPALSAAERRAAVPDVLLGAGDVGRGVAVQDRSRGLDEPTNDICGKRWPSDRQRLARRQVFYWQQTDPVRLVVSSEAVAYTGTGAAAAVEEIRAAVADCTGWRYPNGRITEVAAVGAPAGALPGSFAWSATDHRPKQTYAYRALYQQAAGLLSATYVWARTDGAAREAIAELAAEAARRLRAATG